MTLYQYSWIVLLAPLVSFVVIIFGMRPWDLMRRSNSEVTTAHRDVNKHNVGDDRSYHTHDLYDDDDPKVSYLTAGARCSAYVAILIMAIACLFSWVLLISSVISPSPTLQGGMRNIVSYTWFSNYTIAFQVDQLALAMMVVVTTVALLVMFYSQGYMHNSAGYARFYSYLSLFAFSMLVIVLSENFLVTFIGWELVGLSSYLLIGFWINKRAKPDEQRPAPASAAVQAFVMNRIGDVGFIIGIMILYVNTNSFDFQTMFNTAPHTMSKTLLGVAMLCIFCGAIGKSAQFPLHTWLPSAMEGPTPVSALIHAATMVAAGVYMVARTYPLFAAAAPFALQTVAWVGAFTALFAATIALVQSDFKRVLAFSTISQLGYMFVGLGIAGQEYSVGPGMFHLFTHAFFKALLFLGAGSVIDALHHATHREVQDMRQMGGLAARMPITAVTWLIATMAISGFPFFSGFWSKEFIISRSFEQGDLGIYLFTLITAGLTSFYMLRAFILAFGGEGGKFHGFWGGKYRGEGDPHESPVTMTIPLVILAAFAIFIGYFTDFFNYVSPGATNLSYVSLLIAPDTWIGVAVAFIGGGVAYAMYCYVGYERVTIAVKNSPLLSFMHRVLYNRYYIDTLYDLIVRYVIFGISNIEQAFDAHVVDGIVNGVARVVTLLGSSARRIETGRVQSYMIGFYSGIVVLALIVFVLIVRG
ncbi:MAG TPA: NADH-quinone oxidoreductase subunit L [Dictyobacter sp.]|nr:NADH-quinone oxidoreductase subunit L [Dictyobacter sp.]